MKDGQILLPGRDRRKKKSNQITWVKKNSFPFDVWDVVINNRSTNRLDPISVHEIALGLVRS